MTRRVKEGFTLLEALIATGALALVIGPLMYLYQVGSQTTSAAFSSVMLACLTATEVIRADLDQIAFPDGPDIDATTTPTPPFRIEGPGPDEGDRITFWVPKPRPPAAGAPPRRLPIEAVHYELRPIAGTAAFNLMRRAGSVERPIAGVFLKSLRFARLRPLTGPDTDVPPQTTLDLGSDVLLPTDMLRVSIVALAEAATAEQLARKDARGVQDFGVSFLSRVREPTLFFRLRDPAAGDRYQALSREGKLQ